MVEVGKVAYLRTTQEPVFVLSSGYTNKFEVPNSPDVMLPSSLVRRPVLSRDGMIHKVEFFTDAELTTKEELLAETSGRSNIEALFDNEPTTKAN